MVRAGATPGLGRARRRERRDIASGALSQAEVADICARFQRAVVDALLERAFEAARRFGAQSLGIGGGVSANSRLREVATARGAERGLPVLQPTLHLSTDNAAMIAAAGLRLWLRCFTGRKDPGRRK